MLKNLPILTSAALILVLPVGSGLAQDEAVATHVPESEIMAAYQGIDAFPDQQVRVVDIGIISTSLLASCAARQLTPTTASQSPHWLTMTLQKSIM